MGVISVRELNANVSRALSRVEAGETLRITRNGKVVAELRAVAEEYDTPERREAIARLREVASFGLKLGAPFSYEERTGRDPLQR
jgi:antitoxin (DNA-binding transcriptional repressor) of toxin-antitoxin stability system